MFGTVQYCYNIKHYKSNAVQKNNKCRFYLHPHELNLLIHVLTYYIVTLLVTMTRRFKKKHNLNKSASTNLVFAFYYCI